MHHGHCNRSAIVPSGPHPPANRSRNQRVILSYTMSLVIRKVASAIIKASNGGTDTRYPPRASFIYHAAPASAARKNRLKIKF